LSRVEGVESAAECQRHASYRADMPNPLTLAVAQPSLVPHDVRANAETHAATIEANRADVVVFPELSLTGYELSASPVSAGDPTLEPIVKACAATGAVALAGAPVRDADGREYIATYAVDGEGARVAYRKMWLHEPEPERFVPGDAPVVIEVWGWRLGLAICMDTGAPAHARQTAASGIDAYVASTLFSPAAAGERDERMAQIAAAHGVWVAAASFAGSSSHYPETSGGSGIWSRDGSLVVQAGPESGAVVTATLERTRSSRPQQATSYSV
jgi:predicted amidohydrolase